MPTLLSLPLELRSEILTYALTSCIPAPSSAASNPPRTPLVDIFLRAWTCEDVLYPPDNPSDNATALLLTSRQLYIETKDILSRSASANTYLLDVIFANERALCPTWLCIPRLTTRVDTVRSNFRIIGGWEFEDGYNRGASSLVGTTISEGGGASAVQTGGPPNILWAFYALLERFLRCGPVGALKIERDRFDHDLDRGIIVKTLELNFLSPEDESLLAPEGPPLDWFRERWMANLNPQSVFSPVIKGQMRPEWLLRFVSGGIFYLLISRSQAFQYAAWLYTRIGTIKLLLNGLFVEELHLGVILPDLRSEVNAYKYDTKLIEELEGKRKEVGLSVGVGNFMIVRGVDKTFDT